MKYFPWIIALLVGATCFCGWLASQAEFTFQHPRAPEVNLVVQKTGGVQVARPTEKEEAFDQTASLLGPKAVLSETSHDFGEMPPMMVSAHRFTIANQGDRALRLRTGGSTCKCTLAELSRTYLAPGESAEVQLQWSTGREKRRFEQSATILTNDPLSPTLELKVTGNVRCRIAASSAGLDFGTLGLGQEATAETLIYSDLFEEIQIDPGQAEENAVCWKIEPANAKEIASLEARGACRLVAELSPDLPVGAVQGVLSLTVRVSETEVETLEIPWQARIARPLSVYGHKLDSSGLIDLQTVPQSSGETHYLLVKIRDQQTELPQAKVTAIPGFVSASLTPKNLEKGLYQLAIEIPPGSPAGVYRGKIEIQSGHPRIEDVELPLHFILAAP